MEVITEGVIDFGGHDRYFCIKEDQVEESKESPLFSIIFCVASSTAIQVYNFSELFEKDFDEMDFEVEETCQACECDKTNCSTRLSHSLDDMDLPLSELEEEPPMPKPEYICKDCAYHIADFAYNWSLNNKHEIATRIL